jgi:hypothetical protein
MDRKPRLRKLVRVVIYVPVYAWDFTMDDLSFQ